MHSIFKSSTIISIIILAAYIFQQTEQGEPSVKELQQLKKKWLTVKSWSATYGETYTTDKTWEMRPGMTMRSTIESTTSGTYTLNVQESDGQSFSEWYGYGQGSYKKIQTVVMTSEVPGGTIIITEKIEESSSGAIGDPSKNEYGEFWGGNLYIDIYSGTYNMGFAGPETDGKSTLTRTVEGLPTDYSELEKLPEGLREIFVPLGEKAEEWATYSGPLEDAEGMISIGGLFAFVLPDLDEQDPELPKSGKQLKGSYTSENITRKWSISPGGDNELLVLEKAPEEWIPDRIPFEPAGIKVSGDGLNGEKVKIRFTLYEVSREKGFCLNSQDKDTDFDLQFYPDSGPTKFKQPEFIEEDSTIIIETAEKVLNAGLDIISSDYGAWGKLKAEYQVDEEEDVWYPIYCKEGEIYITIPRDERGGIENHIADQFEIDHGWPEGIETMQDEEGTMKRGDGLTAYEEYRGFMIGGDGGIHITTDPNKFMDLFVFPAFNYLRPYIPDGTIIHKEIKIHLLGVVEDFKSLRERLINFNRGKWSVCAQHALYLTQWNIREDNVLGYQHGTLHSPKTTNYIVIDLHDINKEKELPKPHTSVIIHELMHGCGVDHHGDENENIPIHPDTTSKSFALWNGINAGDITCVMQYGFGDYFKKSNDFWARDDEDNLLPFIWTRSSIKPRNLCKLKESNKHPQLGMPENGACLTHVRVSDE